MGLSSLATVASTAPLVGLLGTLIGIVNAFQPIGTEKTTVMANVAGKLSDACVPTEIGLLVGLASLYGYKYLLGRLDAIDREMRCETGNSRSAATGGRTIWTECKSLGSRIATGSAAKLS